MSVSENVKFSVIGQLTITGKQDGKVLLEKKNAIHPQHVARIFARALAGENYHGIYAMHLGNGGSFIDTAGNITYNLPNTSGATAKLYDRTYFEIVDGTGPIDNNVVSAASVADLTSIVTVTCIIAANEPAGQNVTDSADALTPANPNGTLPANFGYAYNFDEIALVAKDPILDNANPDNHILLTHLVFNPIQKSANRELLLTYTLTISVS
jgi:hypothetical protein